MGSAREAELRDRTAGAIAGVGALVLFLWLGSARIDGFWTSWPYLVIGAALMIVVRSWVYRSRTALGPLLLVLVWVIPSLVAARLAGLAAATMYVAGSSAALGLHGYVFELRPPRPTPRGR